ncbi:MAG: FtsB family cell division protein [Propionibacteriaceae bacterium]
MPSRPSSRPGTGPGRGTSRTPTRSGATSTNRKRVGPGGGSTTAAATPSPADATASAAIAAAGRRRSSLTTRAIALGVVLMVLVISYASSLRIYVSQRTHITETRQQIVAQEATIADLQGELAKWNDPDFVKAQARQRLGWVVPGETGYKVIGPDGKPLDGGVEIDTQGAQIAEDKPAWWATLWGSAQAADDPAPAPQPTTPPVITPDGTKPR